MQYIVVVERVHIGVEAPFLLVVGDLDLGRDGGGLLCFYYDGVET